MEEDGAEPGMDADDENLEEEVVGSPREALPVDAVVEELNALDPEDALTAIIQALRDRPELAPGVVAAACPDLTFAPARICIERRQQGRIKNFNESKGYGFIECAKVKDAFGADAFLHARHLGPFMAGQEVNFVVLLNDDNKPQAFDLQPVNLVNGQPILRKGPQTGSTPGHGMIPGMGPPPGMMPGKGMPPVAMMHPGMPGMPPGMPAMMMAMKGMPPGMAPGMPPGILPGMPPGMGPGPPPGQQGRSGDMESSRFRGVFARISTEGGWGFIECDQTKKRFGCDVFVHKNHASTLEVGSEVSFGVTMGSKGKPQATNIQLVGAPKKAAGSAKREAGAAAAGGSRVRPTKRLRQQS